MGRWHFFRGRVGKRLEGYEAMKDTLERVNEFEDQAGKSFASLEKEKEYIARKRRV